MNANTTVVSGEGEFFCSPNEIDLKKLVALTGEEPTELRRYLQLPQDEITPEEAAVVYRTLPAAIRRWDDEAEVSFGNHSDSSQTFLAVVALLRRRLDKVKNLAMLRKITVYLMPYHLENLPGELNELLIRKVLECTSTLSDLAGMFQHLGIDNFCPISRLLNNQCGKYGEGEVERIYPEEWDARFARMVDEAGKSMQGSIQWFNNIVLVLRNLHMADLIESDFATEYYSSVLVRATLREALGIYKYFHWKNEPWSVMALQRIGRLQQSGK